MPTLKTPSDKRHYSSGGGSPVLVERANKFDYSRDSDTLLVTSTDKEYDMDVTFRECAKEYLELPSKKHNRQKSPDAKLRLGTMIEEWGDIPVRDIDDRMVRSFFRKVKNFNAKNNKGEDLIPVRKISGATYNNYVTYYRAVMNYARDELRAIDFVPKISSVYENVRTTFLEPEQFDRMLNLLDELRKDLAIFAVLTGLRHKQSVHLRIDQVSSDGSRLYFDRRDTKNGMPLEIELSDDAQDMIKKHLRHVDHLQAKRPRLRGKIEHVFVQDNGRPLAKWLNHYVRAKLDAKGFKGIRFHDLRHTFATWLRREGVNSRIIQELGGWESSASMERYAHISTPEKRAAANNLSKLLVQ